MSVLRGGRRRGLVERIMRRRRRRAPVDPAGTMASIHPVLKEPYRDIMERTQEQLRGER